MKNNISYERYQRQIILPGFGEKAQQLLAAARVLVIGAGGLGCPALQYLAAAGVGKIGIADGDEVDISNLHRQVLYTTRDIGYNKAVKAAQLLQALNTDIEIITYPENITTESLPGILAGFDIVVDGTDNFATRYMVNDACVLMGKTLVYGAVTQFEGQVAVFNQVLGDGSRSANYRDLFPQPPKDGEILNCAEAGVIGVLPGIIGTMQASEVIKLITGIGETLANQLLSFNIVTNQLYTVQFQSKPGTSLLIPANETIFRQTDYIWLCSSSAAEYEIDEAIFNQCIQQEYIDIVDVREPGEQPVIQTFPHQQIPLALLKEQYHQLTNETVVVFCQSGKRSLAATEILRSVFGGSKKIYSLKGGILSWKGLQQT